MYMIGAALLSDPESREVAVMLDENQLPRTEFNLRLKVGDDELLAKVSLPTTPIRPIDLLPVIQRLDDSLVDVAVVAVRRQGKIISCRAGCGACCRQLVPISRTEAHCLAEIIVNLPEDRRHRVVDRFRDAIAALDARGLLDRVRAAPRLTDADEQGRLAREYFRAQVACPFLEEESCSIYPDRPLSCREYLVTSPAAHCRDPESNVIEKVPLDAKATQVLFRFDDGEGKGDVAWLPLVLALEWAVAHGPEIQSSLPGERLFLNFLDRLAEQGKTSP
jgi:Fe-S-cluster containining protein